MQHSYSYQSCLEVSERIQWRVEDLIGGERKLDFSKPFLPESLARVDSLPSLTADEKRTLNQIRGHAYLNIFGLVEEFILPFVLDHARPQLQGDDYRVRALLEFASEEAKHIHLFKCFRDEFQRDFGHRCDVIGPPEAIAQKVLSHQPLAVGVTIMHIEWMTQRHYTDSIKDDQDMDPQFKSLLKHHWLEEAQHAKLDTLMIEALAGSMNQEEIDGAIGEYAGIGAFLDEGLLQQTEFDLDAFQRATRRTLTADERAEFIAVQHQANRWTYLGTGMTHENFLATLEHIRPGARKQVEDMALAFC